MNITSTPIDVEQVNEIIHKVAVHCAEKPAAVLSAFGAIPHGARVIAGAGIFDLDNVGTKISEVQTSDRAR